MALHILPIIRALTPLIGASSSIVASIAQRRRADDGEFALEEQVERLENDVATTGRVLASLAEHVQTLAEGLEERDRRLKQIERRSRILLGVAALSAFLAALAMASAWGA